MRLAGWTITTLLLALLTGCLEKPSAGTGPGGGDAGKPDSSSADGMPELQRPSDSWNDLVAPLDLLDQHPGDGPAADSTDAPGLAEVPDSTVPPDSFNPDIADNAAGELVDTSAPDVVPDDLAADLPADHSTPDDVDSELSDAPFEPLDGIGADGVADALDGVPGDLSGDSGCVPDCAGKLCGGDGCGGTCGTCDDMNPCTDDQCAGEGQCTFPYNLSPCDDGNPCTMGDSCNEGTCTGTWLPPEALAGLQCLCFKDKDCGPLQDDDPCNGVLVCQPLTPPELPGICAVAPNSIPVCDDGQFCNGSESCVPKVGCTAQAVPVSDGIECTKDYCDEDNDIVVNEPQELLCNDSNPCTDDWCDSSVGCQNAPNVSPCDDGNPCTLADACFEGSCVPGASEGACDDGVACTVDSCDPITGCTHVTSPALCNDGNPCTDESCDPVAGCLNIPNQFPCDDKNVCTQKDVCAGGKCVGANPLACDDGVDCTQDSCDAALGCQVVPVNAACEDKNPCTADECDALKGCVYDPAPGECSDGDPCTVGDTCQEGTCKPGSSVLDCEDSHDCTKDYCVKGIGCVHLPEDGPCDDANPCTDDSCDSDLGCQYTPNSASCDDLDACTKGDICAAGSCTGPAPASCDDAVACTVDTCKSPTGCVHTPDHDACSDAVACTVNTCDKTVGCTFPPNNLLCNDNVACTVDTCDAAAGCKFSPNNGLCNDNNGCTADTCNAATGCVFTPTVDFQTDPNNCGWCGNKCTPGTQMCSGGKCVCAPQCAGKQCGDNSCGGSCGGCNSPAVCFNFKCCTPQCAGKVCGDNGCGGTCGTCGGTTTCINGACYQTGCTNGKCLVTPGSFWMGCNLAVDSQCYASEYPYHEVILDAYYVDELEVKASDFANFLKTNNNNCGTVCMTDGQTGANVIKSGGVWQAASGKGNYPANMVTWGGAWNYCTWVGKRMCTEAEWEKAARGTDGRKYPWGNSQLDCNHAALGSIGAAGCPTNQLPVGSKPLGASPYGAKDMLGNILEWVEDDFICNFYCKGNGGSNNVDHNCSCAGLNPYQNPWYDPLGFIMGQNQVGRGGHTTTTNTANLRVSARYPVDGSVGDYNRGIRCCDDL